MSPKLRAEYWQFLVRGRLLQVLTSAGHIDFHDVGDYGELPPRISSLMCDELLWIEFQTLEKPDLEWFREPEVWFYERENLVPPPEVDTSQHESYPVSCTGSSPPNPPEIKTTTHHDDSPAEVPSKTNSPSRPDNETSTGEPEQKAKRVNLKVVTPEIRDYLKNNPKATAKDIAEAVGCSRGTVVSSLPWKAVSARRKEERGKSARRVHCDIDIAIEKKSFEDHIAHRRPARGLLHHSDRGVQYASDAYQGLLADHGIQCSMSRRGNCYDNAVMESFFGTLKTELVHHEHYTTHAQARASIFEYIEVFYNRQRLHSTLGYLSPEAFETGLN